MKWWGWGPPDDRRRLSAAAVEALRSELGELEERTPVELEEVRLPEPRALPSAVVATVGERNVLTEREDRLRHASGKSYPDLVRLRSGAVEDAPDAVLLPEGANQVARTLELCAAEGVAVVPFGGGTSVVGGVDPVRGSFDRIVSLDLSRLQEAEVDRLSLTALLGPGLRGPQAEAALGAAGVTLGHFPQSFEYATVGGFAATRSAGQASSGYGRFDELVTSVRLVSPAGELRTLETPHTAAGPALRELVLGSEGVLGVITEVGVRVRPSPEARRYEAWMLPDFESGAETVRALAQGDALPDVIRLSDREETRLAMAMAGEGGLARRLLDRYLRIRGRADGCVVIAGWEGEREAVDRRRTLATRLLRAAEGAPLGSAPGRAWERGRYEAPYLRDELLDLGVMVETLETSHTWSRLGELHAGVATAIAGALEDQGTPGLVLCHVSHVYPDGASLYFTFMARQRRGEEIAQWRTVKRAASDAIVEAGGTITHHHAVGRDHAPYMRAEIGELGLDVLRSVKEQLDPAGIMNPGKLLG
jgi:alkyldihydroxyacetonephosphate synthase